ncbi:unnamed protein product [Meganyctiphanes norvegica]|uniref:Uncharacterized protein n=1 Tax=Meganyctiphanes norvegica TaxID=48144 RepID=A0AAV2SVC0_MEGNR
MEGVQKMDNFAHNTMELDPDLETREVNKSSHVIEIIRTQTTKGIIKAVRKRENIKKDSFSENNDNQLETNVDNKTQTKKDPTLVFNQFTVINKEASEVSLHVHSNVENKFGTSNNNDLSNIEKVKRKLEEITEFSLTEEEKALKELQNMKREKMEILMKIRKRMQFL